MYERNAIVIDRYFAEMLGYDEKNNLKNNFKNYNELVLKVEEYQNISKNEDNTMIEYEKIANEIKDTQKNQEALYKRCSKLQETRQNLFTNLDENKETLQKKFSRIEEEIEKNNIEIKTNSVKFIEEIGNFNEKSNERVKCGRERRIIEDEYQEILKQTSNNFQNINQEGMLSSRRFLKQEEINELKGEIKEKILKNGSKEKIPFDTDVIDNAINISTNLEKRKLEILLTSYERTNRILNEIKNDSIKIEKHKKYLKDANSKMKFLNVINEYIILFLDNERMNVVGGKTEHKKLMEEACQNFKKDIEQIEKLYDLLLKEIAGRSTKKGYKEQYNPEYLQDLVEDEKQFEKTVSKLNVLGTVIYPSYWRVEGMQKIYEVFKEIVSKTYEKDLSEYEPLKVEEELTDKLNNKEPDDGDDEFDWGELLYDSYDDTDKREDEEDNEEYDEGEYDDRYAEDEDEYDEDEEIEDEYNDEYDEDEETENEDDDEYDEDEEIEDEYDDEYDENEETEDEYKGEYDEDEETEDEYEGEYGKDKKIKDEYEEEYEDEEKMQEITKNKYEFDDEDEDKVIDEILGFYNDVENKEELNINEKINKNSKKNKKINFKWNEEKETPRKRTQRTNEKKGKKDKKK